MQLFTREQEQYYLYLKLLVGRYGVDTVLRDLADVFNAFANDHNIAYSLDKTSDKDCRESFRRKGNALTTLADIILSTNPAKKQVIEKCSECKIVAGHTEICTLGFKEDVNEIKKQMQELTERLDVTIACFTEAIQRNTALWRVSRYCQPATE